MTKPTRPPVLALTMGDPAGIGGEIALAAWARRAVLPAPFALIGDPDWLAALAGRLDRGPVVAVPSIEAARTVFARALPVLSLPPERGLRAPVVTGRGDPANGPAVVAAIEQAVSLCAAGEVDAVVTLPINKHVVQQAGFSHPGHTEFLAVLADRWWPTPGDGAAGAARRPVMMLAADRLDPPLRVVPVTIHQSVREAVAALTPALIEETARITADGLTRLFGLARPRLALSGLNPHAGEGGTMGDEDQTIIAPAVAALRAAGIEASGPHPADTLFHAEARQRFDAILGMLHDQALIPLKTLDFHGGVNLTLGLPFVRTSPDHGTGYDIAGRGIARPDSLLAALTLAARLVRPMGGGRRGPQSPGIHPTPREGDPIP